MATFWEFLLTKNEENEKCLTKGPRGDHQQNTTTLSDKISADKIFGGQNFSEDKIFRRNFVR